MKKLFLSLIFITFSFKLLSLDFSTLNKDQINDIKKAVDVLMIAALENETIELSFTLAIIPFFQKSSFERYIETLKKYKNAKNENHSLYPYADKISRAYFKGQDYLKNLSVTQKKSQIKEIELAYSFLDGLGLKNMTKKEIENLLKEASLKNQRNIPSNTKLASTENKNITKSSTNLFMHNDASNEIINALKILEVDLSKLEKLIPATLIDDYYNARLYEYKEGGKYTDQDFENIEKAYLFLKSKSFHIDNAKK